MLVVLLTLCVLVGSVFVRTHEAILMIAGRILVLLLRAIRIWRLRAVLLVRVCILLISVILDRRAIFLRLHRLVIAILRSSIRARAVCVLVLGILLLIGVIWLLLHAVLLLRHIAGIASWSGVIICTVT